MAGRKAKSPAQHLANGETRPSRVNYDVPVFPAPANLDPPAELTGAGLKFWLDYAEPLKQAGSLRSTDMPVFLQRCRVESEIEVWMTELKVLNLSIDTRLTISRQLNQLRVLSLRYSVELGMTSVSRNKIRSGKQGEKAGKAAANRNRFFGKRQQAGGQGDGEGA